MIKELKSKIETYQNLLLKDLCGKLPYGVKIQVNDRIETLQGINISDKVVEYGDFLSCNIDEVKPYLFPLSSMTEEQKKELVQISYKRFRYFGKGISNIIERDFSEWGHTEYNSITECEIDVLTEWLDKNHFDWRGLLCYNLAIDATGKDLFIENENLL